MVYTYEDLQERADQCWATKNNAELAYVVNETNANQPELSTFEIRMPRFFVRDSGPGGNIQQRR